MLNDDLYKRGFAQPYLRCIEEEEAKYVLEEVHGGICGDHMGVKSLIRKIMRAGYFWPVIQQDAAVFVKKVQQLPKIWKRPTSPRREDDNHHFPLTICTMCN